MKVLFCELMYPKTHARSNRFYIDAISRNTCELHVLTPDGFYGVLPKNVILHKLTLLNNKPGRFSYRRNSYKYMQRILHLVKTEKINKVLIASGDYLSILFFFLRLPHGVSMALIHHAELDSLATNRIKKIFFSAYKNKIYHLVFESYMKDYLTDNLLTDRKKVFVINHSLNENGNNQFLVKYTLVGLSNSNDESFIKKIIEYEKQNNFFVNHGIKVIIKSQENDFDDGYLTVIRGYLSDEKYNDYINSAQYIFMPFEKNFIYRESGTLMDALSNKKCVIASDIPLIRSYVIRFPHICFTYNSIDDLCKFLLSKRDKKENLLCEKEFLAFRKEHSMETAITVFGDILNNMI